MKKVLLSLMAMGAAHCIELDLPTDETVNSAYGYMSYGSGFPSLANINLAYRKQRHHNGFEVGVGGTPLIIVNELHGFANYLYYPDPNLESQMYYGLGGQIGGAGAIHYAGSGVLLYAMPQVVVGKSYCMPKSQKQHFIQLIASPGAVGTTGGSVKPVAFPIIGISMGFGF